MTTPAQRAELHDRLRTSGSFGNGGQNRAHFTVGVTDRFNAEQIGAIYMAFMTFSNWEAEVDPEGAHDMGRIPFDGELVYWKIDPQKDGHSVTFFFMDEI